MRGDKFILKELILFFKRKACDEDEKNASTSSKIEKLHENPNIEENEKQLSKVPKVTYIWKFFRMWSGEAFFVFFFLYIIVDDKLYVTLSYILLSYCLDSIVISAYFEKKIM